MGEQPVRFAGNPKAVRAAQPPGLPLPLDTVRRSKPRILWIDDEIRSNDDIVLWLILDGLEVHCETSGLGGLRRALTEVFDAIILDLRLPDITGQGILYRLATARVATPVVVLTGYADFGDGIAAMQAGARDVKRKPIMGDDLALLMRQVIAKEPERLADTVQARHQ